MEFIQVILDAITNYPFICFVVAVAFVFDFTNGMHDSANSVATIVSTRVLPPKYAVVWATFFNFLAIGIVGTEVAKTIGKGMIDTNLITPSAIFCGLLGAIGWNVFTWYFGLPSSSSHALLGGYLGSSIAKGGLQAVIVSGWTKTILFIFIAPVIGLLLGMLLLIGTQWLIHISEKKYILPPLGFVLLFLSYLIYQESKPIGIVLILMIILCFTWLFVFGNKLKSVSDLSRYMQLLSSALYSIGHGGNDAQKTMGIIVSLLLSANLTTSAEPPLWVIIGAYTAIALGTISGGWRIIKTMGSNIVKLKPIDGFAASGAGAVSLFTASHFGVPVSTTHAIAGAITGVGMAKSIRSVHWGVLGHIFLGWVFTIPGAALAAFILYSVVGKFYA